MRAGGGGPRGPAGREPGGGEDACSEEARLELTEWELTSSPPGIWSHPRDIRGATWIAATVPGTAAAALPEAGRDFDAEDWFFRTHFEAPWAGDEPSHGGSGPAPDGSGPTPDGAGPTPDGAERLVLELDGIATVSQVFLNGELILESGSMWEAHAVEVGDRLRATNELVIACRALAPLLSPTRRPRQRWRTRLVHDGNLRWYRTMIFGRSPGYAPSPAPVGPWRPVRLARRSPRSVEELRVVPRLAGTDGVIEVAVRLDGEPGRAEVVIGERAATLTSDGQGWARGALELPDVEPWWPHTHGQPRLHYLVIELDGQEVARRRVGFRALSFAADIAEDGLDLHVNGVPVFARGAVWTPPDLVSLAPSAELLRSVLLRARDAGMNMLRIAGTGAYESTEFFDLCDELGILVWQDLMFASLDYPLADPDFAEQARREVRQLLASLSGRPSLAVLCGSHELEQQPAMLGLDPSLARDPFWEETVPALLAEHAADCAYLRSTPIGGDVPFHADRGIAHYFGVGGYFQPIREVRGAGVRFAAECLPFANLPDEVDLPTHHPVWKSGVQRDAGPAFAPAPGFDFDDVRDFYLAELYGLDPVRLRRVDQERYIELSRAVSGEAMSEVLGEWRRASSVCRGALVLWLKDMVPGAGFGVLDHTGAPKLAYHHLRRALAPVAVWMTDERLSGVRVHVANDRPEPLVARLRVALYADLRSRVAEAEEELRVPAHGALERTVEGMLGRFVDAAAAFGFGPGAHQAIVASLESAALEPETRLPRTRQPAAPERRIVSQAFLFPSGRPLHRDSAQRMGAHAVAGMGDDGALTVEVSSDTLLYGVSIEVAGYEPGDNGFCVEPGVGRAIELRPLSNSTEFPGGVLRALNMGDALTIDAASRTTP